ncbi:MAG: hypothetical protein QXN01_01530 [Candidatus Anstonellales archaeon]
MVRPAAALLVLMLIYPVFSFNASDYLYPGERPSIITSTKFTINGTFYELISFGGVETFLLENGTPLNRTEKIREIIRAYDLSTYYPTPSDIEDARRAFLEFNATRETVLAGTAKKGAEYYCKQYLGLLAIPCNNTQSCSATVLSFCSRIGSSECLSYYTTLTNYTTEFAVATQTLDEEMRKVDEAFSSISIENIVSKVDEIISSIPRMRESAKTIINSKLSRSDPTCGDCLLLCAPVPINLSKLDIASSKINAIKTKVVIISNINQSAAQIANLTQTRISYRTNAQLSGSYGATFSQMQKEAQKTIDAATEAQTLVYDESFNKDVSELGTLTLDIQASLAQNRFFGLNSAFERYRILVNKLNNTLKNFTEPYTSTSEIKENVTDELILTGWIVDRSNLEEVTTYRDLQLRKYELDKRFSPPMSIASYRNLYYNYSQLLNETKGFAKVHGSVKNTVYWLVGNIGRATVDGVLKLSTPFISINYKTRKTYAAIIPPVLIILTDFSLISLALLLFAAFIVRMRKYVIRRIVLLGWTATVLVFIFVLAISSLGFYALLNEAANAATFLEFKSELYKHNSSVIIVDNTNSTVGARLYLSSCADKVGSSLQALNLSYIRYEIEDENCYLSGNTTAKSKDYCYSQIGDVPIIKLSYSPKNLTPKFFVVYTKEAHISGDALYMKRCDISKVIS